MRSSVRNARDSDLLIFCLSRSKIIVLPDYKRWYQRIVAKVEHWLNNVCCVQACRWMQVGTSAEKRCQTHKSELQMALPSILFCYWRWRFSYLSTEMMKARWKFSIVWCVAWTLLQSNCFMTSTAWCHVIFMLELAAIWAPSNISE